MVSVEFWSFNGVDALQLHGGNLAVKELTVLQDQFYTFPDLGMHHFDLIPITMYY